MWRSTSSSSLSGLKRSQPEHEDPDYTCCVCLNVLKDPVTLPCGHTHCLSCVEKVASTGRRACPICREVMPAVLPNVNVVLRNVIQKVKTRAAANLSSQSSSNSCTQRPLPAVPTPVSVNWGDRPHPSGPLWDPLAHPGGGR